MAIPTRAYVGLTVFGLIVTLVMLAATLFFIVGYQAPDERIPLLEHTRDFPWPYKLFGILGTLLAAAFTVGAWRSLVRGARVQEAARKAQAKPTTDPVASDHRAPNGAAGPASEGAGAPVAARPVERHPAASHGSPERPPRPAPRRDDPPPGYN